MNLNIKSLCLSIIYLLSLSPPKTYPNGAIIQFQLTPRNHQYAEGLTQNIYDKHQVPENSMEVLKVNRCRKPSEAELNRKILIVCIDEEEKVNTYDYEAEKIKPIIESFQ